MCVLLSLNCPCLHHCRACFSSVSSSFLERARYGSGQQNWLENDTYVYPGGLRAGDTEGGHKTTSVYIAAYYYCFTTITSVGYGDIHPYNDNERVFAIVLEACGGFLYAIIIASLTSIVTSTDSNKRAVAERLDMVRPHTMSESVRYPANLVISARVAVAHTHEPHLGACFM